MFCTKCGKNELTDKEELGKSKICMLCAMIGMNLYADELGLPPSKRRVDPEKYGRTNEDLEIFQLVVDNTDRPQTLSALDQLTGNHAQPDSPGTTSFQKSVNDQIGANVFHEVKVREIIANGLTEDVQLKLTLPEVYPIREEYYKQTEVLLGHTLEYILHLLAFSPMAGKDWEQMLIEKIEENKRKGGGGVGF